MAHQKQRSLGVAMGLHGRGQVQTAPVQIVQLEASQTGRGRLANASIVEGHGRKAALGGILGKAAIKPLGYTRGSRHQHLSPDLSLGFIKAGSEGIAIESGHGHGVQYHLLMI